ncbi:competence protein ComGF [Salimicrobium halophilum]|uniref:Competence protein ComGF n=2 Tax=Salimicrobium halophilum TaxID=86666 RepID=A0A1G8PUS0_9BACI|nr:competence protein ComGF [Salimicrobium halophilum]
MFKNRDGFTLAEILLSITVMLIALTILIPLVHHLSTDAWENDWPIHQFTQTIQRELNTSSSITATGSILTFRNREGETVKLEPYKNMVRRRVNDKGHEILLYQVKDISFSLDRGFLRMNSTLEGGQSFEKIFFIPL